MKILITFVGIQYSSEWCFISLFLCLLYPCSFSPLEGTRILFVFSGLLIVNLELKLPYFSYLFYILYE